MPWSFSLAAVLLETNILLPNPIAIVGPSGIGKYYVVLRLSSFTVICRGKLVLDCRKVLGQGICQA